MAKRVLQLWVDDNLIKIAQNKNINLSQLMNNVLQGIAERDERLEEINDVEINEKIAKLTEELTSVKALKVQIDEKKHGKVISEEVIDENIES